MMYDLHNHILPGVDDGAGSMEEALTMARQAVDAGTSVMAATPHRFAYGTEIITEIILLGVAELQKHLNHANIRLKIVPGVELPMRDDTIKLLQSKDLLPLGGFGSCYVLIEPPFERIPGHALPLLESLLDTGITPVLAHPERNSEIQHDLSFVESCAGLGIIFQLTAGSILGKFGERAELTAKLIAHEFTEQIILASDAHDQYDRVPSDLKTARDKVSLWLGDSDASQRMVCDRPKTIIEH